MATARCVRSALLAVLVAVGLLAFGPSGVAGADPAAEASVRLGAAGEAAKSGDELSATQQRRGAPTAPARLRTQPRCAVPPAGPAPVGWPAAEAAPGPAERLQTARRCGRDTHLRLGVLLI